MLATALLLRGFADGHLQLLQYILLVPCVTSREESIIHSTVSRPGTVGT